MFDSRLFTEFFHGWRKEIVGGFYSEKSICRFVHTHNGANIKKNNNIKEMSRTSTCYICWSFLSTTIDLCWIDAWFFSRCRALWQYQATMFKDGNKISFFITLLIADFFHFVSIFFLAEVSRDYIANAKYATILKVR